MRIFHTKVPTVRYQFEPSFFTRLFCPSSGFCRASHTIRVLSLVLLSLLLAHPLGVGAAAMTIDKTVTWNVLGRPPDPTKDNATHRVYTHVRAMDGNAVDHKDDLRHGTERVNILSFPGSIAGSLRNASAGAARSRADVDTDTSAVLGGKVKGHVRVDVSANVGADAKSNAYADAVAKGRIDLPVGLQVQAVGGTLGGKKIKVAPNVNFISARASVTNKKVFASGTGKDPISIILEDISSGTLHEEVIFDLGVSIFSDMEILWDALGILVKGSRGVASLGVATPSGWTQDKSGAFSLMDGVFSASGIFDLSGWQFNFINTEIESAFLPAAFLPDFSLTVTPDGLIDGNLYNVYGDAGAEAAVSESIPEPSTKSLLWISLIILISIKRGNKVLSKHIILQSSQRCCCTPASRLN